MRSVLCRVCVYVWQMGGRLGRRAVDGRSVNILIYIYIHPQFYNAPEPEPRVAPPGARVDARAEFQARGDVVLVPQRHEPRLGELQLPVVLWWWWGVGYGRC